MDLQQHIPFLSIFIPIMLGVLTALVPNEKTARNIFIVSISSVIILSGILIAYFYSSGTSQFVYNLGHATAPWVNTLSASLVEAILALTFGLVILLSMLGGYREFMSDVNPKKRYMFFLFLNILFATLLALVYTNDIFTAYVFLEINTIAACVIIVMKQNGKTIIATIKYFVMAAVGSGLFLFTIAMLYGITGHLAMDSLHDSIQLLYASGEYRVPLLLSLILFFISMAIKSALFPFHNWLPDAHSSATPTVSAILSGLVLKGYIVIFIKVVYRIYGLEVVQGLKVFPVVFVVGILSMIMGSVLALYQTDVKKMIAYSSVAQMGYIYAGIGLGTFAGIVAAIFHIISHAVTKAALFLSAGTIIHETDIRDVNKLGGVGKALPYVMGVFAIGGLSLIGIPPSAGFSSKWNLAWASLETNHYWMVFFLTISTLLNIAYYFPIIVRAFFSPAEDNRVSQVESGFKIAYLPILILAVLIVGLGLFSGQIFDLLSQGLAAW